MGISSPNSWTAVGSDAASRGGALDQRFALDVQGVGALRRAVRNSPEEGLRQASRQFEALFMNMVLKSMREATPSSGLLESQDQKVYLSLLDQQLAQNLSGRGLGLAEAMFAQLGRSMGAAASPADAAGGPAPEPEPELPGGGKIQASLQSLQSPLKPAPAKPPQAAPMRAFPSDPAQHAEPAPAPAPAQRGGDRRADEPAAASGAIAMQSHVDSFVARLGLPAQAASAASGVPAPLILAQAALESGWGRREIRGDDGVQSFNLFGIKADRGWRGPVVESATTEYVDGVAQRVRAKFRAYGSYEEAFTDYARFLTRNPRYARVLASEDPAQAARGLQRAGYATDPQYGDKLVRIMQQLA